MTVVALIGAGGNMGCRITTSLADQPGYELRYVETGEAGRHRLQALGVTHLTPLKDALDGADLVVMAVPDLIIGSVAAEVVPQMDAGATIVCLDPAAAHAGRLPQRDDINCFVVHPTHPPLYHLLDEESRDARHDYWGGGLASQSIVCALAWGEESAYTCGETLATEMFRPVIRAHRLTVAQMALLEPGMSESVTNGCISVIRECLDRVIAAGVPEQAARDFMMGHLQLGIAILFEQINWQLSAGAKMALAEAREVLFKPDWHRLLDDEAVLESTRRITGG